MMRWYDDGRKVLAAAIVFAVVVAGWMLRYELIAGAGLHKNRLTGVVCRVWESCWLQNGQI